MKAVLHTSIELVIFDFDGTLFDTRLDICEAVNFARRSFGLPELTLEKVTGMVGDGVSLLAKRAFSGDDVDLEEARSRIVEYYHQNPAEHARPYPGVEQVLRSIRQTKVIVSNKPRDLVEMILSVRGLREYFSFVGGGDSFNRMKPDPEAVEYLIKTYRLQAGNLLIVGDHSPDIELAKRSGVRSVYCNYGFFGNDQVGADFQIESILELPPLLSMLNGESQADLG